MITNVWIREKNQIMCKKHPLVFLHNSAVTWDPCTVTVTEELMGGKCS